MDKIVCFCKSHGLSRKDSSRMSKPLTNSLPAPLHAPILLEARVYDSEASTRLQTDLCLSCHCTETRNKQNPKDFLPKCHIVEQHLPH